MTPTGFYAKPLPVIDQELDDGIKDILGQDAGTDADGKLPPQGHAGQLKTLIIDGIAAQWDQQEAIVASFDPGKAAGVFLDVICSLTGTIRQGSRRSVATGIFVGTPNTTLAAGRAATVQGTAARFATATGTQIATGTPFSAATYGIGDLRYSSASRIYMCIATGTISAGEPSGIGTDIAVGTSQWRYLGDGIGYAIQPMLADVEGPIGAATGAISEIATPVDGWKAIFNARAAAGGALREKDPALRPRREQELAGQGSTTADAVRADVLAVNEGSEDPAHEPPNACKVFFNDTDFYDANGVPPHSIEVLVRGGTEADIAQAIWDSLGAGTRTYGNTSAYAVDSEGAQQLIYFSRPTDVPIWAIVVGRYEAAAWPPNSDSAVAETMRSAFLTYTADYPVARDARTSPLNAAMMRGPAGTTGGLAIVPAPEGSDPVPGLIEVESIYIGIATGPTSSAQISIGPREAAVFDTSRLSITATVEDP